MNQIRSSRALMIHRTERARAVGFAIVSAAAAIVRRRSSRPPESFAVAGGPWVSAHVIAALFPEAGLVFGEKADAFNPLRGFPGVELWNDQPHWAAMFSRNRLAVVKKCKQRIFFQEIFDRNIRRPAIIIRQRQNEFSFRFQAGALGNLAG